MFVVHVLDGKWVLGEMENIRCLGNEEYVDGEHRTIFIDNSPVVGCIFFKKVDAESFYMKRVEELGDFADKFTCTCGRKPDVFLDMALSRGIPVSYPASITIKCECNMRLWVNFPYWPWEKSRKRMLERALEAWGEKLSGLEKQVIRTITDR